MKKEIPQIFFFTKQTNGDLKAVVNPAYLNYYRFTQGLGKEEMMRLDIATWERIRAKLVTMSDKDKRALIRREWTKDIHQTEDMPAYVENDFLKKLEGKKSIVIP